VIDEALAGHGGIFLGDLVFLEGDGDACGARDEAADGVAEGANGEIEVGEGVLERDAVGDGEGAFEERAGDFKADEVVEGLRGEAIASDLGDVEVTMSPNLARSLGKLTATERLTAGCPARSEA
jgi:hypothetical protein